MDRGIDLVAHTVVALARRDDMTVEQAELHVSMVLIQYMQATGLGAGVEGSTDPACRPAVLRTAR